MKILELLDSLLILFWIFSGRFLTIFGGWFELILISKGLLSVFWCSLGHIPPPSPHTKKKKKINTYFFYFFQFFTHHKNWNENKYICIMSIGNRDKGKYIINGCSLGHFYKKNFLTNLGCSLGHFFKKIFSHNYRQLFGTLL